MRIASRLLSGLALGATLACSPAPKHDAAADAQAIRDIDARWNEYIVAKNDSAIAAIYDTGAVLMPPNMPALNGAGPIRAFWAGLWGLNASLTLAVDEVIVDGDLALDRGRYTFSVPQPDGSQSSETGKYLVGWRRVGGEWKAVSDIYNSDTPPVPAAAPPK